MDARAHRAGELAEALLREARAADYRRMLEYGCRPEHAEVVH